jgi:phage terminase large subunit
MYNKGQKGHKEYNEEWNSWRFSSYDNPYVKSTEIDKKKKQIGPDTFAQEYLAEFTTFEGRIYKEFKPPKHVIKPIKIPEDWKKYGGFDFSGGTEPAALVIVAVDPNEDTWYVIKEMYMKEKPSRIMIAEMRSELEGGDIGFTEVIWCDPHMRQLRLDYEANEFYMSPARKEAQTQVGGWVRHGIDIIKGRLKINPIDGHAKLYVFNTCEKLIEEFQQYEWKDAPDETVNAPGVPIKKNDHGLDALRYFAVSYQKMVKVETYGEDKNWKIGL